MLLVGWPPRGGPPAAGGRAARRQPTRGLRFCGWKLLYTYIYIYIYIYIYYIYIYIYTHIYLYIHTYPAAAAARPPCDSVGANYCCRSRALMCQARLSPLRMRTLQLNCPPAPADAKSGTGRPRCIRENHCPPKGGGTIKCARARRLVATPPS